MGLYQHDLKARHLQASLDEVVESCVNYVGVDVNTASPALLRYVSGLNQLTARRLYEQRLQAGPFRNRQQLKEVPGIGEATFVQAAGFLKLTSGDNPLDATWIHPESYEIAGRVLSKLESTPADLLEKDGQTRLQERIAKADVTALAAELGVGELSLRDILGQLARPGRDPREDPAGPGLQAGDPQAGRPRAGHGASGHGAQRGQLRGLHRHRHARQRTGPRQPVGRQVRPRPARRGGRGRHYQGLGGGGR